jgi:predicted nucleotide-binding protein (sugar kinase/HSP70/actin superfamily)
VLHAVRENYLQKVAREGAIGKRICFQGATAKNRALVAAFEQKLKRPIRVSKYCHLTGALGTALLCAERGVSQSTFRGFRLFETDIPLQKETCNLCQNHCKVVKADVMGEVSAYGFLCGRDHDSVGYVSNNRSGFDLLKTRNRLLRVEKQPTRRLSTVGIPSALYLVEDMPLWMRFFQSLGYSVVTSEACPDPVGVGKRLARAEFCAPVAAFHGHVAWLADKVDYLFVPFYLEAERPEADTRRQFCYYCQYAPSLIQTLAIQGLRERVIMPLFTDGVDAFQSKARLFSALRRALPGTMSFAQFASAHREAVQFLQARRAQLRAVMARETAEGDVSVVLLGRPYTCLPSSMNKRIPETLAALGVKTFFQDMLTYDTSEVDGIRNLLDLVHWNYAAKILEAAQVIAHRKGLYPVLVTSFKCAPDSCTLEFFRRILDAAGKPYLILELDEHASSVGYETRIEAAVGAFRNHLASPASVAVRRTLAMNPAIVDRVEGKTLVLPNWDPLSGALLVANLQHEGVNAVLMRQDTLGIQKSLRMNTGQCIPLTAATQGFMDTVRALDIDPGSAVLWTIASRIACNIGGFPGVIKGLLEEHGDGFERAQVYGGEISFLDFSVRAGLNAYFAYMFGGLLRRLVCRIRPYELREGETDRVLERSMRILRSAFRAGEGKVEAVEQIVDWFEAIPTHRTSRPKVAIFGDIYTRDNDVMNQDLIRFIEKHGGEVVTTPYHLYARLIADTYFSRWLREGRVKVALLSRAVLAAVTRLERKYQEQFNRILGPGIQTSVTRAPSEVFERFAMTDRHSGESLENLLEIVHVLDTQPDTSLFVQAVPAFCCPSLVTEAMSRTIERATGVPIVTVIYDGTHSSKNDVIIPYLKFPRQKQTKHRSAAPTGAIVGVPGGALT